MDRPENEKEFLMLYFDDQANLQTWVRRVVHSGVGPGPKWGLLQSGGFGLCWRAGCY